MGLTTAPAIAYTAPASAAGAYRPVACWMSSSIASDVMPMPSRAPTLTTSRVGPPGIRHTAMY